MAVLRSKDGSVELVLRPYQVSDSRTPTWVSIQLSVRQSGKELMSTTVSLTKNDVRDLQLRVHETAAGERANLRFISTDFDFALEVEPMPLPGDMSLGLWVGEPYELMRGYRFIVDAAGLDRFARDVLEDESRVDDSH